MKKRKMTVLASVCASAAFGLLMGIPSGDARGEKPAQTAQGEYKLKIPFGLEETAVVIPADNPLTNEKVELGRLLFFDKRLSQDNTIACANCHLAKFAFTDGKPVAT
ncbi:MAG TPA: cytochrome c peroxidase, partial [Nitrospiraceae bacterium]